MTTVIDIDINDTITIKPSASGARTVSYKRVSHETLVISDEKDMDGSDLFDIIGHERGSDLNDADGKPTRGKERIEDMLGADETDSADLNDFVAVVDKLLADHSHKRRDSRKRRASDENIGDGWDFIEI